MNEIFYYFYYHINGEIKIYIIHLYTRVSITTARVIKIWSNVTSLHVVLHLKIMGVQTSKPNMSSYSYSNADCSAICHLIYSDILIM